MRLINGRYITSSFVCSNYFLVYDKIYGNIGYYASDGAVTFANMYANCYNLVKVDFPDFEEGYIKSYSSMFSNCWKLCEIPDALRNIYISSYTTAITSIFNNCYNLGGSIRISGTLKTSQSMASTFAGCRCLEEIDLASFKGTINSIASTFYNCSSLKTIETSSDLKLIPTTCASAFNGCYSLKSIHLGYLSLSSATTVATMFSNCFSLKTITIDTIVPPTNKLTTASGICSYTYSLESFDISNWNLSAANITAMFYYSGIKELKCNNVTPSALTQADSSSSPIFAYNPNIRELDASWINMGVFSSTYVHSTGFRYMPGLVELIPPTNICKAFTISESANLSKESMARLVGNLSTVASGTKLTVGTYNSNKLTST